MRYAAADVRKQFFIEMFPGDISLKDYLLDLIDNSLDAYLLKEQVDIFKALSFEDRKSHQTSGWARLIFLATTARFG